MPKKTYKLVEVDEPPKKDNLKLQSIIAMVFGFVLIIAGFISADPSDRNDLLYNPLIKEGLILYLGIFLLVSGILIFLASLILQPNSKK